MKQCKLNAFADCYHSIEVYVLLVFIYLIRNGFQDISSPKGLLKYTKRFLIVLKQIHLQLIAYIATNQ
jgi:hypothetical protein